MSDNNPLFNTRYGGCMQSGHQNKVVKRKYPQQTGEPQMVEVRRCVNCGETTEVRVYK